MRGREGHEGRGTTTRMVTDQQRPAPYRLASSRQPDPGTLVGRGGLHGQLDRRLAHPDSVTADPAATQAADTTPQRRAADHRRGFEPRQPRHPLIDSVRTRCWPTGWPPENPTGGRGLPPSLDPFRGYATALAIQLPHATRVLDPSTLSN
jgi:hypothetical protein